MQAQILNLLRQLQRSTGVACLFISHDLGVVRRMTTRVAVLYLGRVVETGTREELYTAPRHPYPVRCWRQLRIPTLAASGSGAPPPSRVRCRAHCGRRQAATSPTLPDVP